MRQRDQKSFMCANAYGTATNVSPTSCLGSKADFFGDDE